MVQSWSAVIVYVAGLNEPSGLVVENATVPV